MNAFFKVVGVALLLQLATLGASQVSAGETELAVLTSYVGNWQGEGALVGHSVAACPSPRATSPR
jgi:hypothetical protein